VVICRPLENLDCLDEDATEATGSEARLCDHRLMELVVTEGLRHCPTCDAETTHDLITKVLPGGGFEEDSVLCKVCGTRRPPEPCQDA
jgi:hypothetical protein